MGASAVIKYPGKVAIRRAVEAARANGIDVGSVQVSPDGSIRIIESVGGRLQDKIDVPGRAVPHRRYWLDIPAA